MSKPSTGKKLIGQSHCVRWGIGRNPVRGFTHSCLIYSATAGSWRVAFFRNDTECEIDANCFIKPFSAHSDHGTSADGGFVYGENLTKRSLGAHGGYRGACSHCRRLQGCDDSDCKQKESDSHRENIWLWLTFYSRQLGEIRRQSSERLSP